MKRSLRDYIPNDDVVDEVINKPATKRWGEPIYEEEDEDIDFIQPKKTMSATITIEEEDKDLEGQVYDNEEEVEMKDDLDAMPKPRAPKDANLMNEGKMTNLEKDELKARIDASRPAERQVTLRRFTTDELYSELGRRLKKNDEYLKNMRNLIDNYYDEDADLADIDG